MDLFMGDGYGVSHGVLVGSSWALWVGYQVDMRT